MSDPNKDDSTPEPLFFSNWSKTQKTLGAIAVGLIASSGVMARIHNYEHATKHTAEKLVAQLNNESRGNYLSVGYPFGKDGPKDIIAHLPNCKVESSLGLHNGYWNVTNGEELNGVERQIPIARGDDAETFLPIDGVTAERIAQAMCSQTITISKI